MKRALPVVMGVVVAAVLAGVVVGPARGGDGGLSRGLRQLELWSLDARFQRHRAMHELLRASATRPPSG